MSRTLEEAIARCEKIVKEAKKSYEVPVADGIMAEVGMELTKKGIEEYQQYTKWLKELAERRKLPEIVYCKDCKHKGTRNCVANAWTTIFGFGVKDDFYCGLTERRTDEAD